MELGELQRYALVDMRCKVGSRGRSQHLHMSILKGVSKQPLPARPCTPAAEDKELLRFLVARKWHVDAAVEQFQADTRAKQRARCFDAEATS